MINIKLPDGKIMEFDAPVSALAVAEAIGPGLARVALAARIDGHLVDLSHTITADCDIELITAKSNPELALELMRHSCAHVMAEAICEIYPEAQLVYGPTVENGFYYDIDLDQPITPDDFSEIEKEMKRIVAEAKPFVRYEMSLEEAMAKLHKEGNCYKVENANRAKGDKLSFYVSGDPKDDDFEDLCLGPHVPTTKHVGAFKVMNVAGAYFHGDASQKMLQRIYATSFADKKELKQYLFQLEEAKKRDHRVIGKQLELFTFHEEGPGFPFLHANGMVIWNELMDYWRQLHNEAAYTEIRTPIILNENLWHKSGHWDNYKDNMYFTTIDDGAYAVKPMNCPGGCLVYGSRPHSYKEFPIRMAELGLVHRHEASGTLHGLMRLRQFTQDDAHIFMLPEQIESEVVGVIDLIFKAYNTFGLTDCHLELSTKPAKAIGTDEMWDKATSALEGALKTKGVDYKVNPGDGAFYGPKIDFHVRDCLGRSWQLGTIQLDFALPERFDLNYTDNTNTDQRPVMIHRVVFGAVERFMAILIEHYAGNFPLWLSPEQARVMPISEKTNDFGYEVLKRLEKAGLRASIDAADDKVNAKIKRAHGLKIPYMLVTGPAEKETDSVAVRIRGCNQQKTMKVDEFIALANKEITQRQNNLALA
ncbi:MAG: threonine--tRNA ligase [Phycisphaerae bacterium]|nr:threonine--tRNA ligase [Phycisphaerae bacterium]